MKQLWLELKTLTEPISGKNQRLVADEPAELE